MSFNFSDFVAAEEIEIKPRSINLNASNPEIAYQNFMEFYKQLPRNNLSQLVRFVGGLENFFEVMQQKEKLRLLDPVAKGFVLKSRRMIIEEACSTQAKNLNEIHHKLTLWRWFSNTDNPEPESEFSSNALVSSVSEDIKQMRGLERIL